MAATERASHAEGHRSDISESPSLSDQDASSASPLRSTPRRAASRSLSRSPSRSVSRSPELSPGLPVRHGPTSMKSRSISPDPRLGSRLTRNVSESRNRSRSRSRTHSRRGSPSRSASPVRSPSSGCLYRRSRRSARTFDPYSPAYSARRDSSPTEEDRGIRDLHRRRRLRSPLSRNVRDPSPPRYRRRRAYDYRAGEDWRLESIRADRRRDSMSPPRKISASSDLDNRGRVESYPNGDLRNELISRNGDTKLMRRRRGEESNFYRDARTVFVWQLSQKVDEDDVYDLFSRVGRIRDVRLIMDRHSGRHKGHGYVEFYHEDSVHKTLSLNGCLIRGYPIAVRPVLSSSSERADSYRHPKNMASKMATVVEIPQPPPPPMPPSGKSDAKLASERPSPSQISSDSALVHVSASNIDQSVDSSSVYPFNVPSGSAHPASGVPAPLPARLVDVKELAILLNPHGLPVVPILPVKSMGIKAVNVNAQPRKPILGAASLDLSLPESQQVPLPIPGMTAPASSQGSSSSALFTRLYVGSVPFTVSEEDLITVFKPFGDVISLQLQRDPSTGRSRGYGFVEFSKHESAKKALDLNGLVLAGRSLRVNLASATGSSIISKHAQTASSAAHATPGGTDNISTSPGELAGELDEGRDGGLAMNATQRALLMQRLSRGEDMGSLKKSSNQQSTLPVDNSRNPSSHISPLFTFNPPCTTTDEKTSCILLSNMFDPIGESKVNPAFDLEVADDVRDEVTEKYGAVKHLFVDKASHGLVYIAFDNADFAERAKLGLNGRWFGGKCISASFVAESEYKSRLPNAPLEVAEQSK